MLSMKIKRPTLLLDESKVRANIDFMVQNSLLHNVQLAPHFKTHQSKTVGQWYKEAGIKEATVSSVTMAKYFAAEWEAISIVFPCNVREVEEIDTLAANTSLTILVNSMEAVAALKQLKNSISCYIEIDAGYHRTGIQPEELPKIEEIVYAIVKLPRCNFRGFYVHSGHSYSCRSPEEIQEVHGRAVLEMNKLKKHFHTFDPEISLGDTPSCSTQDNFQGIDVIRPGNFVFYDLTQERIGSCEENQIAIVLAVPIVGKSAERKEVVVYGGGVHVSKDRLETTEGTIYGKVCWLADDKWSRSIEGCFVKSISQEHGILNVTEDAFNKMHIGDVVGILPVHSCMMADCMGGYHTLQGESIDHASGRKQLL